MSFSSDVKSEISKTENISSCCLHAQVYGLVLFAHFSKYNFSITTENTDVFDLYLSYLKDYCEVNPVISDGGSKKLTAYLKTDEEKSKAFEKFGHTLKEPSLRINRANISEECCASAFLRGVFLSCGTVTDPERAYHLEFVVRSSHVVLAVSMFDTILPLFSVVAHQNYFHRVRALRV